MESLILESFGSQDEVQQPPVFAVSSLMLLEDNLPALTLELAHSVVRVLGDDITCLSKLKTLSLNSSKIYVDGHLEVTLLTNVTHLDLTRATCYWEDAVLDALNAFTAWPSLAVLKVCKCNLFDIDTVMDVCPLSGRFMLVGCTILPSLGQIKRATCILRLVNLFLAMTTTELPPL